MTFSRRALRPSLLPWALALLMTGSHAQEWYQTGKANPNFVEKPVAAEVQDPSKTPLPAYPKPENLLPFDIGPTAWNKVFVDGSSLSIGNDKVVRYTLVVQTAGGANNVSYEGINCDTWERLAYAHGRQDGTWYRPASPKWTRIPNVQAQIYYKELAKMAFCDVSLPAASTEVILANLKKNAPR